MVAMEIFVQVATDLRVTASRSVCSRCQPPHSRCIDRILQTVVPFRCREDADMLRLDLDRGFMC